MTNRTMVAFIVAGLAALASGCSNSRSGGALPPSAAETEAASAAPFRKHVRIRQFADLPEYGVYYTPTAVVAGPGGKLWVTDDVDEDYGENAVVAIATSGKRTNTFYYPGVSTEGASFEDIAPGPDGALWITDSYNYQIVRMTAEGEFKNFPLSDYAAPIGITVGPDRALWFTAQTPSGGAIGRIATKGRITIYATPAGVANIVSGPDGALWFTEDQADRIGRITTRGKVTEFSNGITPGSEPWAIASGPDGALWFTELRGGRIGRITTAGSVSEFSRGITPGERPYYLAAGPDGAMWFTEFESSGGAAKIGRISMDGSVREHSKGLARASSPTSIAAGPDGRMWFVEFAVDKMGRVSF